MTLNFFNRLLWAVVLIVLQAFIFNQVCLFGYATPILYVYILCLQPLNTPRYAWLFWGFGVGLVADMFSVSPGLGAASMTITAMAAPVLLHLFAPKDSVEDMIPGFEELGRWKYIWFVTSVVFVHQASYVLLEFFSFFRVKDMVLVFLGGTVFTILLLLILENIRKVK